MGSGTRLLGKLQDRELGVTRQQQQLLEDDGLCPRGSGGCRGWGLSQAITSITLPLPPKYTKGTGQCLHHGHLLCWEQSGGAGALGGTGWGTAGQEAHWDCPGSSHLLCEGPGVSWSSVLQCHVKALQQLTVLERKRKDHLPVITPTDNQVLC